LPVQQIHKEEAEVLRTAQAIETGDQLAAGEKLLCRAMRCYSRLPEEKGAAVVEILRNALAASAQVR
jgi:hypothetical protein